MRIDGACFWCWCFILPYCLLVGAATANDEGDVVLVHVIFLFQYY